MKLTKYIGEQFGNPTGIGGKLSTFIMNRMNQKQYNALTRSIDIRPGDAVLDIGFGNGYLAGKLAKAADASFWGIDISEDMLAAANKQNRKFVSQGKMNFQVGDAVKMSFEDSFFDKVYTVNTIYFWQDLSVGLSEIKRVLKPGGIFRKRDLHQKISGQHALHRLRIRQTLQSGIGRCNARERT